MIVLNDGENLKKLEGLQDGSLKELLKYQGDSSAFDSDEQKTMLDTMPPDLSDLQIKLVEGFFPNNQKFALDELEVSIQEGFIKHAGERLKNL